MTDYAAILQRVQAQIRQLELAIEQAEDQMKPLLMQEKQVLSILRALEEQKQELAQIKQDNDVQTPKVERINQNSLKKKGEKEENAGGEVSEQV